MLISIITLSIVFLLIIIRQISIIKLQIWQIMLAGAVVVLVTGEISAKDALASINIDVMIFLFSMFIIGKALEESKYLSHLSYKLFKRAKNERNLLFLIIFLLGLLSALLMNDTIAIIGTPMMLLLSKRHDIEPKLLLLALAFSVTIGSVISPIGNPQNLLISINSNIKNPFITFIEYLFIPTIINLFVVYIIFILFFKIGHKSIEHVEEDITDHKLVMLTKISLLILISLILLNIILFIFSISFELKYIALISTIPIWLSSKRFTIIKGINWHTLIFFASMFVLTASVWESKVFQEILDNASIDILSLKWIFVVSILLSQLISNVPLVALYLPFLLEAGANVKELIALAVSSTIAGNLSILGAASNVIIIQEAYYRSKINITFIDFVKIGIPLTIINIMVYWLFFLII
ncbi:MAG: SLC13 family permease [Candidatus Nitrosocaldaceae archaeon]